MQIPNDFKRDIETAYEHAGSLDKLFIVHKPFLMRLVRHATRYFHWAVISDEDDLFQEACIWLVNSLWEWDKDRGTPLAEYVVYNIGARLKNQISKEQRHKRRPEIPPKQLEGRVSSKDDGISLRLEETINGNETDPESLLILRRTYARIEQELPLLARELLESLLIEGGNFSAASERILSRGRVRRVEGMSDDAFRQALRRKFLGQLRTVLVEEHIISADDPRL